MCDFTKANERDPSVDDTIPVPGIIARQILTGGGKEEREINITCRVRIRLAGDTRDG